MNWTLTLSIDRSLFGVRKAASIVREALSDVGSAKFRHEMELALVEACTNSVKHGSAGGDEDLVTITVEVDDQQICVVVEDSGKPFQLDEPRDVAFDARNMESLPTCGMGLPLIRELMDSVIYEPHKGKNRLVLVKRLRGGSEKVSGPAGRGRK